MREHRCANCEGPCGRTQNCLECVASPQAWQSRQSSSARLRIALLDSRWTEKTVEGMKLRGDDE